MLKKGLLFIIVLLILSSQPLLALPFIPFTIYKVDNNGIVQSQLVKDKKLVESGCISSNDLILVSAEQGTKIFNSQGQEVKFYEGLFLNYPKWSPDNKYVLFVKGDQICKLDIETGNVGILASTNKVFPSFSISPDAQKIIYLQANSIPYLMDLKGNNQVKFLNYKVFDDGQYTFNWSPDGKYVLFSVKGQGSILYDFDTKQQEKLSAGGELPTWAHNGNYIAWLKEDGILIYNIKTKKSRYIYKGFVLPYGLCWSPDDNSIIIQNDADICKVEVQSGEYIVLVDASLDYIADLFGVLSNGDILYFYHEG